jgi:hypothetical protein
LRPNFTFGMEHADAARRTLRPEKCGFRRFPRGDCSI